jgi:SMC interacting uncharacterized protein involved in chromosome segregation
VRQILVGRRLWIAVVVVALVGLVGSGPVSAAVDGLPNPPSPPTISADTAYLDGLQSTYDQHLATIDALAAEMKANRSKLDDLLDQRSAKATELSQPGLTLEKRRALEAEITALDMQIAGLRSRSEALSDELKAKNLYLQQMFDLMLSIQTQLDRLVQQSARGIKP